MSATPDRLEPVLNPSSIAIIGASSDTSRIGGIALDHLSRLGFAGQVFPINPKYQELAGYRCYPDVESLPMAPNIAVLALPVNDVMSMLERCHAKGIPAAIVYAAGYAEVGGDGVARQRELVNFARRTGMRIVGPNCMGLANLNTRAITSFVPTFRQFPPDSEPGRVSLVTQSGSMCSDIYVTGRTMGMHFRHFINTGNEACIEFSDYLDYLAGDGGTEAIAGYVEGLRDGSKFIDAARRLRQARKPLILLKAGESERGAQVTQSHTAALAGNRAIYRAAFAQLGVMQARHTVHLADLAYLARFQRGKRLGSRVVVASISGAMGAVTADLLSAQGLQLPQLSRQSQQKLLDSVPGIAMVCNPVDMTGQLFSRNRLATEVLQTLLAENVADILLVFATGSLYERIAPELIEVAANTDCLVTVIATSGTPETRQRLEAAGIPVFPDAARASEALGTAVRWVEGAAGAERWSALRWANTEQGGAATELPERLDEHQVKQLLTKYGVPVGNAEVVCDAAQAEAAAQRMSGPLAMKILSPDIAHKTEVGGVRLNLQADAVGPAAREMLASVSAAVPGAELRGLLLQPMEHGVCELIIGVTRDPVFGLTMTVGLGGIMTELFQDVAHRLLPVDGVMAREMLQELRAYRILQGFRGKPAADVEAVVQAIAAVSSAAMALGPALVELEINPLLVKPQGQGAVALDALLLTTTDKATP
ncbi:acetate--CoA ligase family protein [Bradyrhizobium sp. AS23.2]|uniref:acetate--CoA ligase family protein n=1 Tax=Bradyrhizobium sp. AS23.2 TaxID=1680155 RepID=UPI00093CE32B|nr:acetate--CoA ligase family protein [Bradyrhizobium sp. AS23.2]OKO83051.1 CoA-binding protein [Bradyrhizobium sp. AS23.2]